MFKCILVPSDRSEAVTSPLHAAIALARQLGGKIVLLCVADQLTFNPFSESVPATDWQAYEARERVLALQHLEALRRTVDEAGVRCDPALAQSDTPAQKILETAQQHQCDAIFMSAHRRPRLLQLFVGSQTQKVLAHATVPVMVFREPVAA